MPEITLGVVDQSPVRQGGTAAQALRETVMLAQAAERAGYERFWVAEHHSSTIFAGTAPEILIGQIAANTSTIRVGSGGVMLTHYSALKVAEVFRLLSAFYPGRIEVGIGRAPGSDQHTMAALAHPRPVADVRHFPRQVADLVSFVNDTLPEDHPFTGIDTQPGPKLPGPPEIWLLGSSDYSAQLAGMMGLPFAFADFFGSAADIGPQVADLYRARFQPSDLLAEPKLAVAVQGVCAETEEQAQFMASSMRLAVAQSRIQGGRRTPLVPPEDASKWYEAHPELWPLITQLTKHYNVGTPEMVREGMLDVAERYGTTDLIVAANCYSFADRVRSFELIAGAFGLKGPTAPE
ncbi:MAG: LLM class flavin-dependent oxidoreductase [Chloroflexi bacterium]|nr:LLM class flavin-dependent oxidoreductase [Chloroflexota bacterium]